jgi:uncharacterized repeat protein (TIGR01451 family)
MTVSFAVGLFGVAALLAPADAHGQGWYDPGWQNRKPITITGSQIAGDLSDFPVLISLTDADLSAGALANGFDILFTDANGTTKLDHERTRWVSGTGELIAWVKVTSLTAGVDKTIYMYYGNAGATDQQSAAAVWSNGYEAVYHLDDDFADATGKHPPGTNFNSVDVPARIGDGQDFEQTNLTDHIDIGNWSVAGSLLTIQAWVRYESFSEGDARVVSKAVDAMEQDHVFMLSTINAGAPTNWRMRLKTGTLDASGTTTLIQPTNTVNLNTWYLTAATYDGSTMRLLHNGGQVASVGKTGNLRQNGWSIYLGNNPRNGATPWYKALDGILDEVRISSAARSSSWLTTEYNNQRPGATFYGVEPEQAGPGLSSAGNQIFWVGKAATTISAITISAGAPGSITAANDIRIRIPAGFDMTWDALDVAATIGGGASGKVSPTVSYEDAGMTLVLDVTSNFASGDTITISDLSFVDFTAASGPDNLELEVDNAGTVAVEDDQTIEILPAGTPTISSELDQSFRVGDPPVANSTITVRADAAAPTITAANDIRIHIPSSFNMRWDVSDVDALILGTGASKVSSTVSYEGGGRTLVIDVLADFDPGDLITVLDLSFTSFSSASLEDNLELEVGDDNQISAYDDKVIFIVLILVTPDIHSSANQFFTVGDPPTPMRAIRVTDDDVIPQITAANDIRIHIPAGFDMLWDVTDLTGNIGGPASSKVSTAVTYENGGRTLVLNVLTDFQARDWINVLQLSFASFTSAEAPDRLELEVYNDGSIVSIDQFTKEILGSVFSVDVWPDTVRDSRLPSNGTNYTVDFTVSNIGSGTDSYDLLTSTNPGTTITAVSISGADVSQGANPDSARVSNVPAGESRVVTVTYSVNDVPVGTADTLRLVARSVTSPTHEDDGRMILTVIRPNITISKVVNPSGTQLPGTDLTYTGTLTNAGTEAALGVVSVDSVAAEVEFKVGSVVTSFGGGIGVTVEYSDDDGATWTYSPVSLGCGAPAGYDGCVTDIRWTLQDPLPSDPPDDSGTMEYVARIK